jgi:hypothetical protein
METPQQRKIRRALERSSSGKESTAATSDPEKTTSLQAHALEHTDPDYVPKTLTPHEWEAWYAEHGVPAAHRQPKPAASTETSLWSRLKRLVRRA